jgi:O-antigen biosynthesis protein
MSIKIVAFSNDTGSVQWRLTGPANYINSLTEHEYAVGSHKDWDNDTMGADVIVAQMWRNPKGIDVCHEQGAKVVYDADDIIIGVGGKDRKTLMDLNDEQTKQTIDTIKKCDLVTVTTEKIAEHYRQFNDNVLVLPNYLDYFWWGKPLDVRSKGSLRIGWAGSLSHREDLMMISPIIEKICKQFDFVKFVYCGAGGKSGLYGEEIFENIPPHQREYISGVPLEYFPAKSKTLGFDIAIAPLLDDEFNAGKSAIKYYEYAANGVPGVYSDTVVYNNVVKHGETGYLAKTKGDWEKYLTELIMDEKKRLEIAKEAYKHVFENYNLDDHYPKWVEAYEKCLTQ